MDNELIILHEDNHIIVVLKPQNVPSQEDSSGDKDMLTMVKDYIKVKYAKTGNVYTGLVHRLDRPTGGIMVFAKTSKAAARLSEAIQRGEFYKKYICICVGSVLDRRGKLTNYLLKDTANNVVRVVQTSENGAKKAELDYNVLDVNAQLSLVDIKLDTGRSHQIRVQLSHIGLPIFGDTKYGGAVAKGYNLALWAYELKFTHPVTKDTMTFRAYPPTDEQPWKNFQLDKYIDIHRPN